MSRLPLSRDILRLKTWNKVSSEVSRDLCADGDFIHPHSFGRGFIEMLRAVLLHKNSYLKLSLYLLVGFHPYKIFYEPGRFADQFLLYYLCAILFRILLEKHKS